MFLVTGSNYYDEIDLNLEHLLCRCSSLFQPVPGNFEVLPFALKTLDDYKIVVVTLVE